MKSLEVQITHITYPKASSQTRITLGYLYFHAAPDKTAFHQECVKRVKNLHTADCLRANKYAYAFLPLVGTCAEPSFVDRSTMAWGLEARVPFLDKSFLDVAMNIDAAEKTFTKGADQELDADGQPKMEKV